MVVKASLSGLNARESQKLKSELNRASNSNAETMEDYVRLIRLVKESFTKRNPASGSP